ncbi:uncharacterized protein LOC143245432 [Tachypleus tridentatus]|uniref:uncharacterized protein LOC143245432 n=1 Tax=Tachypleus tridentatus TaxID=6853 RepID=UPI003FD28F66
MSHFRNSFTLPHPFRKFKLENGKRKGGASSMPSPALPRAEPILYTGVRSGVDYYGLSMLEDFCPSKRHSAFPDFYGGYTNHSPTDSHSDYESAASESVNQSESENTSLAGSTLTSSSSAGTPEASIETSDYAQTSSKYNGESKPMYSSSGLFTDVHCCCKTNCHANAGSTYRLNLQCCHHMEPLWETGVSNTGLRTLKGVNWYDRKLRHRSCPIFQRSQLLEKTS